MEHWEVVERRKSIRDFKDDPIDPKTLREIVEEAAKAPSWVDSQPWRAYVATGDTLRSIKEEHWDMSKRLVDANPVLEPMSRELWPQQQQDNMAEMYTGLMAFMQEKGLDPEAFTVANNRLFNAPAIVYMAIGDGSSEWSIMDLGGFSYGVMLAAADRGIDSIPAYEFVRFPDSLAKHLEVDEGYSVVMGVGLGYRSDSLINDWRCSRRPFEDYAKILA